MVLVKSWVLHSFAIETSEETLASRMHGSVATILLISGSTISAPIPPTVNSSFFRITPKTGKKQR